MLKVSARQQLNSVKKLRETLNTQVLKHMGVNYIPGIGRGSKSYLVKAA